MPANWCDFWLFVNLPRGTSHAETGHVAVHLPVINGLVYRDPGA